MAQTAKGGQMKVVDSSVNERFAKASALNRGFVRERGIERTSTSRSTATCRSKATSSAIVRVEWPTVKMGGIAWDCRADFLATISIKSTSERENEDQGKEIKPKGPVSMQSG